MGRPFTVQTLKKRGTYILHAALGFERAGIFAHAKHLVTITNLDVCLFSCAVGGVVKWKGSCVDL